MIATIHILLDANIWFALIFLAAVVAVGVIFLALQRAGTRSMLVPWLIAEAVVVGVAIIFLTFVVFAPVVSEAERPKELTHLKLPAYDYQPWLGFAVQAEGRTKPLDAAAREVVRQICGREKFDKQPAIAVVLQWILAPNGAPGEAFTDWERKEFILCDHQGLRDQMFAHLSPEEIKEKDPKYVSPSDMRSSPGLKKLLDSAEEKRKQDREKAQHLMSPEERKAEEVAGRLTEFDALSRKNLGVSGQRRRQTDPLHIVALDKVPSGGWFSIGELQDLVEADKTKENSADQNGHWMAMLYERLKQVPQLYIGTDSEPMEALREFQGQLGRGEGGKAIDDLEKSMTKHSTDLATRFGELMASGRRAEGKMLFDELARTPEEKKRVLELVDQAKVGNNPDKIHEELTRAMRTVLIEQDQARLRELRSRVAGLKKYNPDDPKNRMIHLDYLECRFPTLYRKSLAAQPFPRADAEAVLASHQKLVEAYRSNDPEAFAAAGTAFMGEVASISEKYAPYPGNDTLEMRLKGLTYGRPVENPSTALLNMELMFNRVQPFMWAWVVMLFAVVALTVAMATHWRFAYGLGLGLYLVSMGFQCFGFLVRISISGRPPVSNMYETVVWVAFMSTVFALVLELIYRKRVIALAGAMVATLGLVLADQLPLALDPKISPLVPVLRSNYWLTIHVLTIVSSYAGGTLAWGLGNIALAMLAFGSPRRDVLKTLSQFTYRAIQIAVLLLAAGTFLGGWWAAESWGRFWGWDPKEVWALIALVCYVIPLHARYIGWVKDFGLAVSAVLCYAAIVMSWYGVNFVLGAGLHSYGFGGGGPWWVFWAGLINIEWVLIASIMYQTRLKKAGMTSPPNEPTPEDTQLPETGIRPIEAGMA
jgi:ABC-type transport system involved in cytochrome c biogenesis permease subunit